MKFNIKKMFTSFCAVSLALCMSIPAFAKEAEVEAVEGSIPMEIRSSEKFLSEEAHIYDVIPGTDEWNQMTPEQRYESCKVTIDEVESMTTSALLETVLDYPYFINIYAYDSIDKGIKSLSNYFPGIQELLDREDVNVALQEYSESLVAVQSNKSDDNIVKALGIRILKDITNENNEKTSGFVLPRASSSSVKTPNGTKVQAFYDLQWSDHIYVSSLSEAKALSKEYLELYPSAKIVRSPSPSYNCHSYAWYSTSSTNKYWIDNPSPYITDGSYTSSTAKVGNVITYEEDGSYTHSGIITATPGGPVTVTSKWGPTSVFSHDVNDCPYVQHWSGNSVTVSSWAKK